MPWPGSNTKGMPASAKSRACCSMPSRPSGDTMPSVTSLASATWLRCEWPIAPGWKAVIWLSSRSVVMKAWPVKLPGTWRMWVCGKAEVLQALRVGREVVAHRRHDQRMAAQQLQVVGDVARAAAVFAAHLRHQEGDVEDVDLFGQDVVLELVLEHHDGVVGHRTADQCLHVVAGNNDWEARIIAVGPSWAACGIMRSSAAARLFRSPPHRTAVHRTVGCATTRRHPVPRCRTVSERTASK